MHQTRRVLVDNYDVVHHYSSEMGGRLYARCGFSCANYDRSLNGFRTVFWASDGPPVNCLLCIAEFT